MSEKKLKRKAESIRSRMCQIGQLIQGSMNLRRVKCGKLSCRCRKGALHENWCITYKDKGETKTVYVNEKKKGEALLMCANYKRMKKLIKELSLVNLELIKSKKGPKYENGKKRKSD